MRVVLGVVIAAGAAFAFSFAADLLFGAFAGVYPSTAYLPVTTWSLIAVAALVVAYRLASGNRWLSIPFVGFGGLALLGAVIGSHPHNYVVAALLLGESVVIWRMAPASHLGGATSLSEELATMNQGPDELDRLFNEGVSKLGLAQAMEPFLDRCDFAVARRELSNVFEMANARAGRSGQSIVFKDEFVNGWKQFSSNPNAHTAKAWLAAAPEYSNVICPYIIHSCPGGRYRMTSTSLGQ